MARPPETLLSSAQFKLSAKGAKEGEYAKFGWDYSFGHINATFFSGAKEGSNDERYFRIRVSLPVLTMYCNALQDAALPGPFKTIEMALTSGMGSDKKPAGSLLIGKDEDGMIWTSVYKEGFLRAKYYLTLPMGLDMRFSDGTKLSKEDISARRAKAHASSVARAAILTAVTKFDPDEGSQFNKKGGGGSGGYARDDGDVPPTSGW